MEFNFVRLRHMLLDLCTGNAAICALPQWPVLFFNWISGEKEYKLDRESPMLGKAGAPAAFPAELCTVGVPRDPWDFLSRAIEVGHPRPI
jgi:hypothetical protein